MMFKTGCLCLFALLVCVILFCFWRDGWTAYFDSFFLFLFWVMAFLIGRSEILDYAVESVSW